MHQKYTCSHFRLSVIIGIALFELTVVENPRFAVGNFDDICHTFGHKVLPVLTALLLLPVFRQRRVYLWTLFFEFAVVEKFASAARITHYLLQRHSAV